MATQLTQGMEVGSGYRGFTEASKVNDLGDDKGIPAVVLSLADIHGAQGIGLHSVDDVDRIPFLPQMSVES